MNTDYLLWVLGVFPVEVVVPAFARIGVPLKVMGCAMEFRDTCVFIINMEE